MAAARFCRFCLITDVKMNVVNSEDLEYFNTLIEPSPQILACYECIATIDKIKMFLNKYTISQAVLGTILETQRQVSENDVKSINRKSLKLESNLKCDNPLIISLDTQSEEHVVIPDDDKKSVKQTEANTSRTSYVCKQTEIERKLQNLEPVALTDDKNHVVGNSSCDTSYAGSDLGDSSKSLNQTRNTRRSARNSKIIKSEDMTVKRKKYPKRKVATPPEICDSEAEVVKAELEETEVEKLQTISPNEFSFLEKEITIWDDEDDDILYLDRNVEDVINSLNQVTKQKKKIKSKQKQIKSNDSKIEADGLKLEKMNYHKRKLAKIRDIDRMLSNNDYKEKVEDNMKIDNSSEFSFLEEEISIFDDVGGNDQDRSDIFCLDNILENGDNTLHQITKYRSNSKNTRKHRLRALKSKTNFTKPRHWDEILDDT